MLSNFWQASEVSMMSDVKTFPDLSDTEKESFLKIISLLSTLDSSQTKAILLLSLYTTDPSVQSILAVISQQEAVHNESYSYILSSLVSLEEQKAAFEIGRKDPVLLKRNEKIQSYYNAFIENPTVSQILKTCIYSTLLEGLFFYSGFSYFYNLARQNKMVGTSTMISYINRDELEHSRFISELIRATLNEHPELNNRAFIDWVYEAFEEAVDLEIEWSHHVLTDVSGIDLEELEGFIKYRANKMLRMIGMEDLYPDHTDNPMKWIRAYVDNIDDTKTDFFEQKSRQYTKVSDLNGFDDL